MLQQWSWGGTSLNVMLDAQVACRFLIVQYLMFGDNTCFLHAFQGSCLRKNKFAAGVVFEGLHPCRVAVHVVENHDIPVAKAQDSKIMMSPLQM